ncbi:hypothetical protein [Paucisalibacillus sp. EB02]|uniref:hypothetical protein n=1 Tax=Paucisalibacillus sp. EB02 TaxID=1347087 RepID=UPI0005A857F1|nr:hypothetical protein [Paucisalibacillus sp. EB02]
MGYILPVQQHEYAEYQRRMVTRKREITSVEKPYKIIFKTRYEELKREEELKNQNLKQLPQKKELCVSYIDLDEVFTEITGLGNFINERI